MVEIVLPLIMMMIRNCLDIITYPRHRDAILLLAVESLSKLLDDPNNLSEAVKMLFNRNELCEMIMSVITLALTEQSSKPSPRSVNTNKFDFQILQSLRRNSISIQNNITIDFNTISMYCTKSINGIIAINSITTPNSITNIETLKILIKALDKGFKEYSNFNKSISQSVYGEAACNTIELIDIILTSIISSSNTTTITNIIDIDIEMISMCMTRRIGVDDTFVAKYSHHYLHILNTLINNGHCNNIIRVVLSNEDIVFDRLSSFGIIYNNDHDSNSNSNDNDDDSSIVMNGLSIIDNILKSITITTLTSSEINNVVMSLTILLTNLITITITITNKHIDIINRILSVILIVIRSNNSIDNTTNVDRFLQWVSKLNVVIDTNTNIPLN
jgi:hypothetical protein